MEIKNFKLSELNPGCHGIPNRCLTIGSKRMKICARCFGSTIGHAFALILLFCDRLPHWYISLILLGVLLADWSLQEFAKLSSNNPRRLITGLLGGFGVGAIICNLLALVIKSL